MVDFLQIIANESTLYEVNWFQGFVITGVCALVVWFIKLEIKTRKEMITKILKTLNNLELSFKAYEQSNIYIHKEIEKNQSEMKDIWKELSKKQDK